MARCPFAEWLPSPNYSPGRPGPVLGAMQHSMAGTFAGSVAYLRTPRGDASTSAHFCIRLSDGHIVQLVDTDDQAWHAFTCNARWVGIEHDDDGDHADPWRTDALYASSVRLNKWLAQVHGYQPSESTIQPHRNCVNTECPSGLDMARIITGTGGSADMPTEAEWRQHLADEANTIKAVKDLLNPIAGWVFDAPNRPLTGTLRRAMATLDHAAKPPKRTKPTRAQVRAGHGRKK